MTDRPFYAPDHAGVQPRVASPGEGLWTLTKKGHACHAELRQRPGDRWELQLFVDGEFRWGQLFVTRGRAEAESTLKRAALEQDGWVAA